MDVENSKNALFLRAARCSQVAQDLMRDLSIIKAPLVKRLTRKNNLNPFDDDSKLEQFLSKFDTSLFCFGRSLKKRPHSIVLGRTFSGQILDMVELGIDGNSFKALSTKTALSPVAIGSKPMILFNGLAFQHHVDGVAMKNLFIDFFRGHEVDRVNLAGLDRVIVLTTGDESFSKIQLRHYAVSFVKSGSKTPNVSLQDIGPSVDFTFVRRTSAAAEVVNASRERPRKLEGKKRKNVEPGTLGRTMGRIHMRKQNLPDMALRKFTKRSKANRAKEVADRANARFQDQQ